MTMLRSTTGVAQALAQSGRIDVLVNNAGIGRTRRGGGIAAGGIPPNHGDQFLRRAALHSGGGAGNARTPQRMHRQRDQRGGTSRAVSPQAPYAASKWALEAASEALAQEMKSFGVRVAIVEPGVIATPIFGKVAPDPQNSHYPHARRLEAIFAASLKHPVSPYVVGEAIRRIVESDSWQLRYPVGPDAAPFLAWRASMSDEDWVNWAAVSDEEWMARVKRDFGLDVKL